MVINIFIIIVTVFLMECFAWFSHKYIMHGFMWVWHKSHHSNRKGTLEINDLFGIIFGLISALLIVFGSINNKWYYCFWIGLGIFIYGVLYFVFHDVIVHQRLKFSFSIKNKYLRRIVKAHHIHHKISTKDGGEAFGFLFAKKKYSSKKN